MANIAIFRINYKSDFILTLNSDAGWMTPFCIKFWTDAPSQAYFVGYDGETYTHCAPVTGEPTKLLVQFDDHHLPIGDLKFQIGYHFTVADFPTSVEDEVINQASVIIEVNGAPAKVMLDLNGETAPEIEFSLPAYANEAQRIENEQQRIENEQQRIEGEQQRIDNEQTRQRNEETRIENEQERVLEFGQMKGDLEQATRDAAAAAENANDKGVYAKNQGDYAKQQGDTAKADHERAEEDHTRAGEDHTQAGSDHTRAGEDHTQAGSDHTRAGEDHTRAGEDHTRAGEDHTRAESDHAAVEVFVDSLGAFDISAYHATGGVLAKYADLTTALGTNGANVPDALRKGGMSVKFVQSSDNKYVQYRLMADTFNTTVSDWQGLDIEPTRNSPNLVESGGVYYDILKNISKYISSKNLVDNSSLHIGYFYRNKNEGYVSNNIYDATDLILIQPNTTYVFSKNGTAGNVRFISCFDVRGNNTRNLESINTITTTQDECFIIATFSVDSAKKYQIEEGSTVTPYESYKIVLKSDLSDGFIKERHLDNLVVSAAKLGTESVAESKLVKGIYDRLVEYVAKFGYTLAVNNLSTYQVLDPNSFFTIKAGTTIKNNGIYVTLGSDSSLTQRKDLVAGGTWVATFDVKRIQSANTAGNINILVEGSGSGVVPENSVGEPELKDEAVSEEKTQFAERTSLTANILDPTTIISGKYINNAGTEKSGNYGHTGFIPVDENGLYCNHSLPAGGIDNCRGHVYNASKERLRTLGSTSYTYQEGDAFVIFNLGNPTGLTDPNYAVYRSTASQSYVAYVHATKIKNMVLPNDSVGKTNLKDKSVSLEATTFAESINLYDYAHDTGFEEGMYLSTGGSLNSNPSYDTTGFIPVEPNTTYAIFTDCSCRFLGGYDINKSWISGEYKQWGANVFTTGENTYFIRISFYATDRGKYGFAKGDVRLTYQPYKLVIPSNLVGNNVQENFYLPKHIYVAAGRTIELYYDQMLLNANKYNIRATCGIGKSLDRKFQIIGQSNRTGNYTLTIEVFDDLGNKVASGSSTIHVVSNSISGNKKVVPFGDSLTNDKPWLSELSELSGGSIVTVGTRRNAVSYHEGRSGASVSTYMNDTGGIVYNFDRYYCGKGYGTAPTFDDNTPYSADDIVKVAHTFGNGQSGYRYCVFKVNHAAGPWNESEIYDLSQGNPLYDYKNEELSIQFYKTFHEISYDAIILYLGTNGITLTPETNPNGALGIKNLIELIREDEPTIPIIVINTIFRSSQNGIGNQGNTDGYIAQSEYKYNADKKVLLLAKAVDKLCGSMSNVYLCPVGFTHDSKYNFGNTKIAVNPRLTSTDDVYELQPSDSIHPQNCGYLQMADEMFSTLCAVFNT